MSVYWIYIIYPVTQVFFMVFLMLSGFLGMLYIPDLECPQFLATQFSNINVTNSSQLVTCCTQLYNRFVCVWVCAYLCVLLFYYYCNKLFIALQYLCIYLESFHPAYGCSIDISWYPRAEKNTVE